MSSKVQLAGGNFQDAEGNVLANGYLILTLSQDAQANQNTQVAGGRNLYINLDGAGNIITAPAQSVWGNDVLTPVGTFYTVKGYTQSGQLVFGPNTVTITGTPEFDAGTWIPSATNTNPSNPPAVNVQQILLEVNGAPSASQNTLNLISGTNVTLNTSVGGGVIISAAGGPGGGGASAGPNVVPYSATPVFDLSLGTTQVITLTGSVFSSTVINGINGVIYLFVIIQDAPGGHTFTWPTGFKQAGAINPFSGTTAGGTAALQQFANIQVSNSFYAVTPMIYGQ